MQRDTYLGTSAQYRLLFAMIEHKARNEFPLVYAAELIADMRQLDEYLTGTGRQLLAQMDEVLSALRGRRAVPPTPELPDDLHIAEIDRTISDVTEFVFWLEAIREAIEKEPRKYLRTLPPAGEFGHWNFAPHGAEAHRIEGVVRSIIRATTTISIPANVAFFLLHELALQLGQQGTIDTQELCAKYNREQHAHTVAPEVFKGYIRKYLQALRYTIQWIGDSDIAKYSANEANRTDSFPLLAKAIGAYRLSENVTLLAFRNAVYSLVFVIASNNGTEHYTARIDGLAGIRDLLRTLLAAIPELREDGA